MDYPSLGKDLNDQVSAVYRGWQLLPIWDRDEIERRPSVVHMTYSALLAVIRDAPAEWAAVEVADSSDRDKTALTLTVWTADLVVQAVRAPSEMRPVVSVAKRSELSRLELLSAPLLTQSDWGFHDEPVSVRLTYPAFSAVLSDRGDGGLLDALPSFVDDL